MAQGIPASTCRDTSPSSPIGSTADFSLREMFPRLADVALRTTPMPNRVPKLAENYAQSGNLMIASC